VAFSENGNEPVVHCRKTLHVMGHLPDSVLGPISQIVPILRCGIQFARQLFAKRCGGCWSEPIIQSERQALDRFVDIPTRHDAEKCARLASVGEQRFFYEGSRKPRQTSFDDFRLRPSSVALGSLNLNVFRNFRDLALPGEKDIVCRFTLDPDQTLIVDHFKNKRSRDVILIFEASTCRDATGVARQRLIPAL
jgi:hypothetical protein